jgi:hypothetical protein
MLKRTRMILIWTTLMTVVTLGWTQKPTGSITTRAKTAIEECDSCQYRQLSWAIAKQEGFFVKRSIPNRNHNPGDIKVVPGYRFPGQVGVDKFGHVIFRNDNAGWFALETQVKHMCASEGRYSATMTIQQIGQRYAKDWKRWSLNVARSLGCDSHMTLAELFDIPPVIRVTPDPKVLEGIL